MRRIVILVVAALSMSGCTTAGPHAAEPSAAATPGDEREATDGGAVAGAGAADPRPRVVVSGSGAGTPLLANLGDAFTAANKAITVRVLPAVGSSSGIRGVSAGAFDVAVTARPLTPAEADAGLDAFPIARVAVAFVVDANAGVSDLTRDELAGVMNGSVTSWSQLGGNALPVRIYSREAGDSVTKTAAAAFPEAAVKQWSRRVTVVHSDDDLRHTIAATRGAAGFVPLAPSAPAGTVAARLAGASPSVAETASGAYPASFVLHVIVPPEPNTQTQAFVDFLESDAGAAATQAAGYGGP